MTELKPCPICLRRDIKLPKDFKELMDFLNFRFDHLDNSYTLNGKTHTTENVKDARIQISVDALLKCFEEWQK